MARSGSPGATVVEPAVSELVRRSGRYGEFMGCANYPSCKYTRKM